MLMLSNTIHLKAVSGLLLLAMLPVAAMAQDAPTRPALPEGNFCENIETIRAQMSDNIGNSGGEAAGNRADRQANHEAKKAERLAELETKRGEADTERAARLAELEEKASTDAQVLAVAEFVSTVEALIDVRRSANDVAITDFEAAVALIVGDVERSADDFEDDLKAAVDAAFDEAAGDCEGNADDARAIAQMLKTDLKNVRADFQETRQGFDFKSDLEAARAVRKAAHEAAEADFMAGMETAKETLRAAFAPAE